VIVSIRSLLVVGDGRLEAATNLTEAKYNELLEAASSNGQEKPSPHKKQKAEEQETTDRRVVLSSAQGGSYSVAEAQAAYSHLSDYHKKKGWDTSGWWARKG
jgi:ubiquitin-conjugating enzyme E2 Q